MQWLSTQMGAGKQNMVCTKAEVHSDVHVSCGQVHHDAPHMFWHPLILKAHVLAPADSQSTSMDGSNKASAVFTRCHSEAIRQLGVLFAAWLYVDQSTSTAFVLG